MKTVKNSKPIYLLLLTFFSFLKSNQYIASNEALTLTQGLTEALNNNPEISSQKSVINSNQAHITGSYSLPSPMIGYELNRGSKTQYLTLGQKIEFPAKNFSRANIYKSKTKSEEETLKNIKYKIRLRFISTYYKIYSSQKIIELTHEDLQTLAELSRIAEAKHASGTSAQFYSMKTHVLQTETEYNLISLNNEKTMLQTEMTEILSRNPESSTAIVLSPQLAVPTLIQNVEEITAENIVSGPRIQIAQNNLDASKSETTLASLNFAPDFNFKYQQRINGLPYDSQIISAEISIPLWFWGPASTSKSALETQKSMEHKYQLELNKTRAELNSLKSDVSNKNAQLTILQTSLIPQAQTSYKIALAGYRAQKINFLDLLEAERGLYKVQITYYKMLSEYTNSLTKLEMLIGKNISDLP